MEDRRLDSFLFPHLFMMGFFSTHHESMNLLKMTLDFGFNTAQFLGLEVELKNLTFIFGRLLRAFALLTQLENSTIGGIHVGQHIYFVAPLAVQVALETDARLVRRDKVLKIRGEVFCSLPRRRQQSRHSGQILRDDLNAGKVVNGKLDVRFACEFPLCRQDLLYFSWGFGDRSIADDGPDLFVHHVGGDILQFLIRCDDIDAARIRRNCFRGSFPNVGLLHYLPSWDSIGIDAPLFQPGFILGLFVLDIVLFSKKQTEVNGLYSILAMVLESFLGLVRQSGCQSVKQRGGLVGSLHRGGGRVG